MEIPIYFSLKQFEREYLVDFATIKNKNAGFEIQDYYKLVAEKYFDLHSQSSRIAPTKEDQVKLLLKLVQYDEFIYFLWDAFNSELETLQATTNIEDENILIVKFINENYTAVFSKIMFITDDIHRFILNKIIERNQNNFVGEFDFSNIPDKVRLIVLEKLGLIEFIKSIQSKPDTISHTSEILSVITGIEIKTLNTYIYPMLRAIREDDHHNSPYKNPDNVLNANKVLYKLKVKNIDANR